MKVKSLLTLVGILFFFFAQSQTAPSFNGGTSQTLAICQNSGSNSIDAKLVTTDPDPGQTLTYSVSAAPVHGTVHGFPGTQSTGGGGIVSPSGFDYTPTNGYNGLDSFVVNVSDGTFSTQTKIVVTVNSLPTVAAITGTASACVGSTSQLNNTTSGGVWSSSNVFVADINSTGLVTGQAAGTATISYTVTNATTGCSNAATTNFIVAGYPVVQPITGTTTVCVGSTTQLSSTTSGGTWSSNNTTRATVSNTGLVTGVGAGAVTITYTVTNAAGCSTSVTSSVTVNARPNIGTISASTTTICVGATTQLTIGSTGGTWSSSNTAIATVSNGGPTAGTVTGTGVGIATITYTITNANGCTNTATVDMTVTNGVAVSPITGPNTVCTGKSITLSDATSGGTWSVTPAFRASITSGGVLTGNFAGAATVTYSVTSGGCTNSVTYNITVNNTPTVGSISGSNQVCVGTNTTLSNSTNGGVWSSSNTAIATISSGGQVTGIAAGSCIIKYMVTSGAGCSDSTTLNMTVSSSISVNPIQGGSSVCLGSTLLLTNTTTGGVWNSSDLTVATVVNGTVYPISQGVVAITYTVGTGACSGVATKNVIVNPSPTVGAISGTTALCTNSTSQLSNATSGGTWSSSNSNVASVSGTGLVTAGNFGGNATITYTVTNSYGCTASSTLNVTVNNRPNVNNITGINSTCVGSTTQLSCTTTGGVWASSNTSIAIVTGTGLVIGLAAGVDTISYTVTSGNGCSTTQIRPITVDAALTVAPISGSPTVCIGATPNPTFTCTTSGGTWSSSNTSVLTINASTGQATGTAVGTATVTYTVNNGGACTASSTLNVTVANRPAVPTVSGPTSVCVDASITLTGNPSGGKWVSQQTNFLTIDSTSGVATGVSSIGFPINVQYTVTNAAGCTRTSNNYGVTVNGGPAIGTISPNPASLCVGATLQLTNTTPGGEWHMANTAIATVDSVTGLATGVANGNTTVTYIVTNLTGCASSATRFVIVNTTPTVATTTGLNSVCAGSSTTLYNATPNGTWASSNTAVATVSNTGAVTGIAAGSCNITYTVSSGGIGGCTATSTTPFTVNPVPTVGAITSVPAGQSGVCVGSTLQLTNSVSGGTWTSSNTARATINSSGLVTGVSSGSIIIAYTVSNGTCNATAFGNGTVYALPTLASISGASSLCVGATSTYINDSTGGTWSTSDAGVVTVSTSGVVTAVGAGNATIDYSKTNSNGCTRTVSKAVTVNALPVISTSTGTTSICVGATTTLSNATSGGVWASANASVATVNNSGDVNGISAGIVAIRYIVTNASGCSDSVSTNITVNALPSIASIAGNNAVCVGSSTTLTDATAGGVWSSNNTSVATITAGGVVNGLTAGTTTIKYQVTNASNCTDSVTKAITVNSLPTVAAITGNSPVCVNSTRVLSNTTPGGTWSSNNTSVATVNASGSVLGISAGTATIKYQVTNASGCIDSVTTVITVNALPTVAALTGVNNVCVGLTTTYASATSGGVWGSSNTAIATVDINGVVTGVAAGTTSINYAVTNTDGCTKTVSRSITVNALPTVPAITGSNSVCIGSTINLGNTTTGGVWTSNNTAAATVNSSTGAVAGVASGTTTITYTVSNASGCITSVTKSITVNALPMADFTINNAAQCVNVNSFVLTNTSVTASGTIATASWDFGDGTPNSNALAGVTHVYTLAGTYNITLTVTNTDGCSNTLIKSVIVKATSTSTTNISICPSDLPFTWNGLTFNAAGSQTAHLTNSAGCDSAATLNLTVKANTTSTTNHTACDSYTWNGTTYTTSGIYTFHATNAVGCDSTATLNLTINSSSTSTTNHTACDSYTWNGTTYTTNGTYTFHSTNAAGCDSTATLNLTINNSSTSSTSQTACDSYTWNGTTYTTSGVYTFHATNAVGCDSTATLNLTINNSTTSTTNHTACDSYTWNGTTYTTSGIYTFHATNAVGCDSTATLNLTVNSSTTSSTNHIACDSYTWNGTTYTTSGVYTFHTTNAKGCDSTATLNLTINNSSTSSTSQTACDSYTWNGTTYTTSGVYVFHSTNAVGCDSAATLNLTVNYSSTSTTNQTACDSYIWNGTTYTTSGVYTFHATNAVGCDSTATLNLTINNSTASTTNHTACDSYTWNGTTYTTSGVYTFHATNAVGCDSTATLNLTINSSSTSSTSQTACDSYTWNGTTYTTSGVYTFHATNAVGCDSTATLNLTINYSSTSSSSQTACDSYTWNGTTYTTSGVYTFHASNAVGCDSTATLNLTINNSTTSTANQTACDSYTWNGTTYTTSGVYTFHATNAVGCDSTATLNLTVNYSSTSLSTMVACNSYTWNGTTYTTSGIYTFHATNAVGCDSTATLDLMVNYSTTSSNTQTICASQLPFTWNGLTFNAAGSQTAHFTNAVGCDSAATLTLTVNANPVVPNINGTTSVCVNGTTPLSNTVSGGVWSSDNTAVAGVDLNGVVNGVAAGTATISYTVTNINGCSTTKSVVVTVNALPTVSGITGSNEVCLGGTTTLSSATSGGVWSSVTPAVATVTNGGVVSGVSVGGTTINYTVTNSTTGCSFAVNQVVTVNGLPSVAAITGTNTVCVGGTTTLSNSTSGGVWSSNNTSIATIDANTGIVTGVAAGNVVIDYIVTNTITGCSKSVSGIVTVNGLPLIGTINGTASLCLGSSAILSSTTTGGVWSSSDAGVATVNASTGLVTSVAAGTVTIKYMVTNGSGCTDSVSKNITVNNLPSVNPIVGTSTLCAGSHTTYSNFVAGGIWSSSDAAVATVNSVGLVNGIAAGTATVTYTVTDAITLCSNSVTQSVTVTTPAVAPITGVNALCTGSTSILATTTIGGVWSSSDTSIAAVDSTTGLVTAVANGTATITYTVPVGNACGNSASTIVTVNAILTVAPITGDATICNGATSQLASTTLGGVWNSSNTAAVTIDPLTGFAVSVGAGTSTITYTVTAGTGCSGSTTTTYTVNALPATPDFTGSASVCIGSFATLTPTVSGGVWSSSATSVVSVDNAGNISGVSAGSANITYTVTNAASCSSSVTKPVTVNALPVIAPINGNSTVCMGSTLNLSNDSTGGVWFSFNTAVATVNSSGVVTPVSAGSVIIDYMITDANNCISYVTKNITVFGLPSVAAITGANEVCVGSSITLANTALGGAWSSVTPATATVSNTGEVTGVSAGGTTIKYTVTDAVTTCENSVSHIVTVNATPVLSAITGANSVCLNNTTTFSNTTSGGSWNSNNTSIATVDANTGLITGVGAGTANIIYTVTTLSGCTASVNQDITVNVQTSSSESQTACNSYTWNGTTYTTSGTYTFNATNAAGCDSVATLILTINNSTTSSETHTACNSYVWNGTTYTTSGTYTFNATNAAGCDSVATLILTINTSTTSSETHTACNSYVWNGTTYTTSGTYTFNATNAAGCDSVATLILTINNSTTSSETQTACNSYVWNGTTYTTSGTYTFNTTNAAGCDSVATLILTINIPTTSTTTTATCNSLTWNGTTYTTSGIYTFNTTNAAGCDSVATLILTINTSPAAPSIVISTSNVTVPATGIAYGCTTVSGAVFYNWSYTGTGATIVTGQGTENITVDFDAAATNGDMQVMAVSLNGCNSAPATVSLVLPVTVSKFDAIKVNETTLLKWSTSTELNSKNFEVQRSIDGRTFVTIGIVDAKGVASDYSFVDTKPFTGVNYYRLKQVDKDGKFALSNVKQVKFEKDGKWVVNIYPNPAREVLNVRVSNAEAKQIRVINSIGRIVYSVSVTNAGVVSIPVSHLNAGTYFVEITTATDKKVEKFVKE